MRRLVAVLFACALVASCGLKPDVADQLYRAGPGGLGAGSGELGAAGPDGQTANGAGGTGDGTGSGPGGTGSTGAGGTGAGTGAGGSGGTGPGGSGPGGGSGDNGTVVGKTIRIGVHAPVTGAAAFPQRSFQNAVGVYAAHINSKGGINGRKLEVFFEDDAFNPNTARNKCKYFAQQLKVFLIIGGAGSDQIDSCARYANAAGVPYISAGVHETRPGLGPLSALRTYFAASLTYEQQAPMVARTAKSKVGSVGLMVANNDSLNNYFNVQRGALQKSFGSNLKFADRVPKSIQSEAPTIAAKICNSGVKGVVWNASPSGLINVTKAMTCSVTFFGPGNTNGINIVATGGCPQLNNARFFSSFPQLDAIDSMDKEFRLAYRKKNGSEPDDIGIAMWGVEKLVGQMLQAAGKDLTTQKFLATLSSGKTFSNGVYPPVQYGGNKRFGGTGMHLLRADCGNRQYRTESRNVRP